MTEPSTVEPSAESPRYREAFNRLKDELRAIPAHDLITLNVEPLAAVTTTLKSLPAIKALRSRLIAVFANFDVASFDKLEDYAMAFSHANTVAQATAPETTNFDALLQGCIKQRDVMEADLSAAVTRGHINGERMKELRGGSAHRNVAHDLFILVQIARTDWPKLEGKTFITPAELDRSERFAEDLTAAIAQRERLPAENNEASDDRQRAFTAFSRAHGKTRRAIQYLREEYGDVDETIMPSFYNGRANGRKRPDTQPDVPVPPAPTPVVSSAPAPAAPSGSARIGMPNSEPLTP